MTKILSVNKNNNELKEMTKDCLAIALIMLMDKHPYDKISIVDICDKAGVSRIAFYRNFTAKDAILRYYFYKETDIWRRDLRTLYNVTYKRYFTMLYEQCYKFRHAIRKMINAELSYIVIDIFFTFFKDFTKDNNHHLYNNCHLAGSTHAIMIHWIMNKQPETPEELAIITCNLHNIPQDKEVLFSSPSPISELMTSSTFTYKR